MSGNDEEDLLDNLISSVQKEKKNDDDHDGQEDNFLGSLENLMENDDKTGPALSPELAKVINSSFQVRSSEEKAKTLCDKYYRPENCPNMKVPGINEEIWPSLKKKSQSIDFKIQRSQNIVLKALTPACNLLDKLILARKSSTSNEIKSSNECLELAQDTVKLLQLAFTDLSHKRRYLIRPELKQSYKPPCNDANKVSEFLFGDDVGGKIKKIDASKRVGKKVQGYEYQPSLHGKSQGIRHKYHSFKFGGKSQGYQGTYTQPLYRKDQNNNGPFLGKGRGRRPPPPELKK